MVEREKALEKVSEEEYRILSGKYKELEDFMNDLKKGFKSLERFQKFYGLLLKKVDRIVKKQLEEEHKKIVQENKSLRIKYEEGKKENKRLKEKIAQNSKEWSVKQEELKKENIALKEVAEKYRVCLTKQFIGLQETLWEVEESDREYEAFFNDSVLPLQILIGFEKEMDIQTEEKMEYYIWDVIVEPLIRVMKKRNGEIQNGKLILPEQKAVFHKEEIEQKIAREPFDHIEQYIKEDTRRMELKKIVLQKKRVAEDLGRMLEELEELSKTHKIEKKEVRRLAREAQFLFEKNGIYPMFAEELREYPDSELKRRMIPINPNSIKYPGLFIKRDGRLEVFGTNIGMDDCEENTL